MSTIADSIATMLAEYMYASLMKIIYNLSPSISLNQCMYEAMNQNQSCNFQTCLAVVCHVWKQMKFVDGVFTIESAQEIQPTVVMRMTGEL